jgi:hypothetical protein
LLAIGCGVDVAASEIGHFGPGIASIRDYAVPAEPGFYGVVYTYFYSTQQLNDRDGDDVDSFSFRLNRLPRRPTLTLELDVDVSLYAVAPAVMWVSDWKILGARYAAYVVPTFASSSLGAALETQTRRGLNVDTSTFGVGDLFVQPVWLGWGLDHFDFAFGMGFYAPIGKYDTHTITFPRVGASATVEDTDNIGYGFWTQQTQLAGAWYPWLNKATALVLALTHEINTNKEDFDLTPGQVLSLNWGLSQYLPLVKSQELLLEAGPAGYDTWQVTGDDGVDATSSARDRVHAVGIQLGLTHAPWGAVMNLHWFYEYAAQDRFQGQAFGLNLAKKF